MCTSTRPCQQLVYYTMRLPATKVVHYAPNLPKPCIGATQPVAANDNPYITDTRSRGDSSQQHIRHLTLPQRAAAASASPRPCSCPMYMQDATHMSTSHSRPCLIKLQRRLSPLGLQGGPRAPPAVHSPPLTAPCPTPVEQAPTAQHTTYTSLP